jgi:hypothetical protein
VILLADRIDVLFKLLSYYHGFLVLILQDIETLVYSVLCAIATKQCFEKFTFKSCETAIVHAYLINIAVAEHHEPIGFVTVSKNEIEERSLGLEV